MDSLHQAVSARVAQELHGSGIHLSDTEFSRAVERVLGNVKFAMYEAIEQEIAARKAVKGAF